MPFSSLYEQSSARGKGGPCVDWVRELEQSDRGEVRGRTPHPSLSIWDPILPRLGGQNVFDQVVGLRRLNASSAAPIREIDSNHASHWLSAGTATVTAVSSVTVLLSGFKSGTSELAIAMFEIVPLVSSSTVTSMVNWAQFPTRIVPSVQVVAPLDRDHDSGAS